MLDSKLYMGVLVVNHYLADEPRAFYGSDIKTPNVTEIAVYNAARDTETGEITKQELLLRVEMSDFQFGLNIARPNFGDGNKVTQTYRKGYYTPVYEYEQDNSSELIKNMSNLAKGGSNQVARFIDEAIDLSKSAAEIGRMKKSDNVQLRKLTDMLQNYIKGNEKFYAEEVSASALERVNEIKNSIHRTIAAAGKIHQQPMQIENMEANNLPENSPKSFMGINVGGSSRGEMFDEINVHTGVVTLSFSDMNAYLCSAEKENKERAGFECINLQLSPSQYARILRADKAEVPCTLSRLEGLRVEPPLAEDVHEKNVSDLSAAHNHETYVAFNDAVALIKVGFMENKYTGKVSLKKLAQELENVKVLFNAYLVETLGEKKAAVAKVLEKFEEEVINYANSEVMSLPDAQQERVKVLLNKMANQLVSISDTISK